MDAQGTRQLHELDCWRCQVDTNIGLFLGGRTAVGVQATLENQVLAVVTDDKDAAQTVAGGGPEALDAVHGAAVTNKPEHRAVGKGQGHTHGGRQPPANATALETEVVTCLPAGEELA